MIKRILTITVVLVVFTSLRTGLAANDGNDITVEPDKIEVGLFYSGQKIDVRAETPVGYQVVIKVSGEEEDVSLKKKGKKLGFLWMDVGDLEYKSVPSLYLIRSSKNLSDVADKDELNRLGIGYEALENRIVSDEEADGYGSYFGELIKLKEKAKLFSVREDSIKIRKKKGDLQEVVDSFILPSKAPVGEYEVDIFGFNGGNGTLLGSRIIKLKFGPVTSFITSMAENHGLLYGCLASIIAIIAGLITGFIFKGKTAH